MQRADRSRRFGRPTLLVAALLAAGVQAQTADTLAPEGAPVVFPVVKGPLDYAANAAVARVVVEVARNALPADGQSAVRLTVRLFDAHGKPLQTTALATVEVSAGRVLLDGARTDELGPRARDLDRAVPGVQLKVDGGVAEFNLLAPSSPQDVRVRVTAGSQTAEGAITYLPDLRPMVAAGLIEGVIGLRNRVQVQPVRRGDAFEQELNAWSRDFNQGKASAAARAAFFLKGVIKGDVLLSAAYDSDKPERARLLRDIRPEDYYPVYGDSSIKSQDARSLSRLYLRLDKGRSYVLYGDFVTGEGFSQLAGQGGVAALKQRSLGAVNRSATGLRAHREEGNLTANAFVFNDSLRSVVEEIASQGSGPYGLRHNGVLEGSEKVEIVTRDRNQPSLILAVQPLARGVDYSFEPFSGRILLSRFLPSVDENLNPVSLRISYEVDQGGTAFWAGGVDAQWRVTDQVELGGSLVKDRNPLAPYDLVSANATWRLAERSVLVVEGAQSTSTVNTNAANRNASPGLRDRVGEVDGRAARLEFIHEGEDASARLFLGRSGAGFNNPSAPLAGGRDEALLSGAYQLHADLKLYGETLRSADRNAGGGTLSKTGIGLRWAATETLTLDASLRDQRETIGTLSTGYLSSPFSATEGLGSSLGSGAGGGLLGFGQQALDPISGLPLLTQGGLVPGVSRLPVGTRLSSQGLRLGASWRATPQLRLGAEVEGSVDGDRRRRAAVGADYAVAERTRLYGRYERQSGWVQTGGASDVGRSAGQFALGVASSYWRDTQLFGEYRLRDAISGEDLQLASGVRQGFELAEGVRASLGAERTQVIRGDQAAARALSAGLDYSAHPLWRASGRVEWRSSGDIASTPATDEAFDTVMWQGLVARKLHRDWTLLARHYSLHTAYRSRGDVQQDRNQLGIAYRDTDTNRINALLKIERKHESDASNDAVGPLKSTAWIVSTVADYHPSRPWWLTGRHAAKWQQDRFEGGVPSSFRAQLLAGRVVYDITERWDVSVLAAAQFGQRGARQTAYGAEVGYLLQTNLWLSAGFNQQGFAGDADLAGYEYTRRGAYVRLRFKFDETLFQRNEREVNRSLPR
jgi:hypothetical protein